jgi:hypothetical protein
MYAQVLSLMLIWVMAGTLAWAQERTGRIGPSKPKASARLAAANTHGTQTVARVGFDIPSKPLPQALTDFSLATGVQILYTSEQPFDLTSPPLVGRYTPEQGLQHLLAGTGFTYRFTEVNTVTLERPTPYRGGGRPVTAVAGAAPLQSYGKLIRV